MISIGGLYDLFRFILLSPLNQSKGGNEMKRTSDIFMTAISLLAFLLCAPASGTANQISVKRSEQHSPNLSPKHKVIHLADLPAKAREKIWQHLHRAKYQVSKHKKALPSNKNSGAHLPAAIAPWVEQAKLTASDGALNDQFGASISISGDTVVVGARYDDGNKGSAYIFEKPGTGWSDMTQTAKLTASDGASGDRFGHSVSISGDTVVVGARGDDSSQGSAYIFEKPGTGWSDMTQTAKLTASDGAATAVFGHSVAISGDTVVVGAYGDDTTYVDQGSAYVFEKPEGGWSDMTQTAKLTASDGYVYDELGVSVSISGDTVVVGADGDNIAYLDQGSAYVYERPGGGWYDMTETAKLTASDGAAEDYFGYSVAVSGDTVVVGAYGVDTTNGVTYFEVGQAYVFEKPGGGWSNMTETAKLTASDGAANDEFGYSVAISGDTALVGAWGGNDYTGSAYSFEKPGGGWADMTQTAKLIASDGEPYDRFGISVAIEDNTATVGAHLDDATASTSGSAYVFEVVDPCECDLNNDGSCNGLDWLLFYPDWGRTDCTGSPDPCECDLNSDGSCNGLDWLLFYPDWGRNDCP
jgi:hypothetical protein